MGWEVGQEMGGGRRWEVRQEVGDEAGGGGGR